MSTCPAAPQALLEFERVHEEHEAEAHAVEASGMFLCAPAFAIIFLGGGARSWQVGAFLRPSPVSCVPASLCKPLLCGARHARPAEVAPLLPLLPLLLCCAVLCLPFHPTQHTPTARS